MFSVAKAKDVICERKRHAKTIYMLLPYILWPSQTFRARPDYRTTIKATMLHLSRVSYCRKWYLIYTLTCSLVNLVKAIVRWPRDSWVACSLFVYCEQPRCTFGCLLLRTFKVEFLPLVLELLRLELRLKRNQRQPLKSAAVHNSRRSSLCPGITCLQRKSPPERHQEQRGRRERGERGVAGRVP